MDLRFSPAQEHLRSEIREWLVANLPFEYGTGLPPRFEDLGDQVAFGRGFQASLAGAGWVGITWPREYGGRGLGPTEHFVVQEELARARAPELVGRIGLNLVGPTLIARASAQQCRRWLPGILSARSLWCQLFSEPDAGSDLGSVRTLASHQGGCYLLTGRKVWTSYAQFADYGLCLARTDPATPGPRGLSMLVVDMRAAGVEVRPLVQATGESEFNEVTLDGVEVPVENLIGAEGEGWQVAGSTLSHERGLNPRQLVIHLQHAEELLALAERNGSFDDRRTARRLAQAYAEVRLFEVMNWRALSSMERGRDPGPEGSISKIFWSEMSQRLHQLALDALGPAAPLWAGADANPSQGIWQRSWLYYQAASIFAGTNEIQRNVLAERMLGLPREGRPR